MGDSCDPCCKPKPCCRDNCLFDGIWIWIIIAIIIIWVISDNRNCCGIFGC